MKINRLCGCDTIMRRAAGGRVYVVTVERLKNTATGAPCYKAIITPLESITPTAANNDIRGNYSEVYKITAAYMNAEQVAAEVVEYYENKIHAEEV